MEKTKIVVANPNIEDHHIDQINHIAEKYGALVEYYKNNKEALPHIEDAEIIYGFGPELVENAPNLKWFCSAAAGIDTLVKTKVFEGRDIKLTNSSGSYGLSISEHIIMVSLMLMRRIPEYFDLIANRQWKNSLPIKSLAGSKIVVLGTGNIGQVFAKRVRGFEPHSVIGVSRTGAHVDGFDKVVEVSQLDDVISDIDLLVMCLPGTPETENILSKERIDKLSPRTYVINIGRGSAIDEEALIAALMEDRIAGAGLDVFRTEPLPQEDPLWAVPHDKLIITPHISGQETLAWTRDNNFNMFCEDLENYFEGRPLKHVADIKLGY